jgi:imidazolonepropionase-like amidohydrolase
MKRWQQAGVTPKQFLAAATIDNAKRADLLILNDNPLKNIDAFDSIDTLISAGKVLPRASLAANHCSACIEVVNCSEFKS